MAWIWAWRGRRPVCRERARCLSPGHRLCCSQGLRKPPAKGFVRICQFSKFRFPEGSSSLSTCAEGCLGVSCSPAWGIETCCTPASSSLSQALVLKCVVPPDSLWLHSGPASPPGYATWKEDKLPWKNLVFKPQKKPGVEIVIMLSVIGKNPWWPKVWGETVLRLYHLISPRVLDRREEFSPWDFGTYIIIRF